MARSERTGGRGVSAALFADGIRPESTRAIAEAFEALARQIEADVPASPRRDAALRALLEARAKTRDAAGTPPRPFDPCTQHRR